MAGIGLAVAPDIAQEAACPPHNANNAACAPTALRRNAVACDTM